VATTASAGIRKQADWLGVVADPVRLHILRSLSDVGDATVTELLALGQASGQTLRRHLEDLVAVGVIEERPGESDGETPGRPAARFSLRTELRESVRSVFRLAQ
jgi:predicted ArsR family transcriptional regulator